MSTPLLQVKDLCINYWRERRRVAVVENLGFSLAAGTTLGIIGESGAGKSSLALAITGLLDEVTAEVTGEVFFKEKELLSLDEPGKCKLRGSEIGMIFQDPAGSLDPAMRVWDQVAEGIWQHQGADRKAARQQALIELQGVGLSRETLAAAPYVHQLSGGQCQRVMIAAALANAPDLLIADEPTSSLDVTLQSQIIGLLRKKQHTNGLAMIFITHDLALVSLIADEILVMYRGSAVEHGSCHDVLTAPSHPYTAELVKASLSLDQGGAAIAHS